MGFSYKNGNFVKIKGAEVPVPDQMRWYTNKGNELVGDDFEGVIYLAVNDNYTGNLGSYEEAEKSIVLFESARLPQAESIWESKGILGIRMLAQKLLANYVDEGEDEISTSGAVGDKVGVAYVVREASVDNAIGYECQMFIIIGVETITGFFAVNNNSVTKDELDRAFVEWVGNFKLS